VRCSKCAPSDVVCRLVETLDDVRSLAPSRSGQSWTDDEFHGIGYSDIAAIINDELKSKIASSTALKRRGFRGESPKKL